jgi:hypothetical protein
VNISRTGCVISALLLVRVHGMSVLCRAPCSRFIFPQPFENKGNFVLYDFSIIPAQGMRLFRFAQVYQLLAAVSMNLQPFLRLTSRPLVSASS